MLAAMEETRAATLALTARLGEQSLRARPHADFSPVGWHLGHVAFTEATWVLERLAGDASLSRPFAPAFAQGGRPKAARSDLPPRDALLDYLHRVRDRTRSVIGAASRGAELLRHGFLPWFLAAHEHQHRETMSYVLWQQRVAEGGDTLGAALGAALEDDDAPPMVEVPGGEAQVGTDSLLAYDNERPAHRVRLRPFLLDTHPVTCAAFGQFIRAGGYTRRELWSEEGWRWVVASGVRCPFGWREAPPGRWMRAHLDGWAPLDADEPVMGVTADEADAYARFRQARLPTEHEWERATRCFGPQGRSVTGAVTGGPLSVLRGADGPTDLLGNVWEWTASPFRPYPGFRAFPYRGYSTPYFDGGHRVLKGGSFATSPLLATAAFRNWYLPQIRPIFAGFRCARDR
jgi:gamma-glutamyl hercynylcysteine S-oxide synthase